MIRAFLYDAKGSDREVTLSDASLNLNSNCLLWVDVDSREAADLDQVGQFLQLDPRSLRAMTHPVYRPHLDNYGGYFQFALHAAPPKSGSPSPAGESGEMPKLFSHGDELAHEKATVAGAVKIDFLVGSRWVLTVHTGEAKHLRGFRKQDKAETLIGALSPQALAASLVDWHLETFFEAIAHIEAAIDQIDEAVLGENPDRTLLAEMVGIRRRVAQLRALLTSQRPVFHGLSRPDFAHIAESDAVAHFHELGTRLERAIDSVEKARDLVVGSFDLFATRTAQQTNELVKVLTFVTVLLGFCAAIAGLFGMNFDPPFFRSGYVGFFTVTGGLIVMAVLSAVYARRRDWI